MSKQQNHFKARSRGATGNFGTKNTPKINFSTIQPTFADITPIVSTRQLPPKSCHIITLVHRVGKTANITGKKLLSLKPVVRT
jgi:hypothetical protein